MPNRPRPLEGLELVGLDFESYFEKNSGYSLRNQAYGTSTYVRNEQFQTLSVAIRREGQRRARSYRGDQAWEAIHAIDWDNAALLAHHAQFDGLILTHHYGVTPRYYCCTLSMARALHGNAIGNGLDEVAQFYGLQGKIEDVLEQCKGLRREEIPKALMKQLCHYNANDVDIMWQIFQRMIANGYPDTELDIIDLTVSLFTEPVLEIDRELAAKERDREREEKRRIFRKVAHQVPWLHQQIQDRIDASNQYVEKKGKARKTDLFTVEEHMQKVLNSNPQFATVLESFNIAPPMKPSPTDPSKETFAFAKNDLKFQALQAHSDPQIRTLAEARLRAKSNIGEERAIKILERSENGMRFPVYLKANGAHTLRWSGGDGVNPQNFPVEGRKGAKSALRRCIRAPKGMKLIVVDSAQIEARENGWLAGEKDLLEAFMDPKRDPYCEFASRLYGRTITKADEEERAVGKVCILGLGYGMGAAKLQLTLAQGSMGPPVFLSFEMCQKAVDLFRTDNARIKLQWQFFGRLLAACLHKGQDMEAFNGLLRFYKETIDMPNGLSLHYPNLGLRQGKNDDNANFYYRQRGNEWSKIYGGLLVENCIAEGTLVLTERGWVPIEKVQPKDRVHDGVEWVTHGGTLYKSIQPCVMVDGVRMTSDHEVLTDEGWQPALDQPRPYRPDLRGVDCDKTDRKRRPKDVLALYLRMWGRSGTDGIRSKEAAISQLRVSNKGAAISAKDSWHEQTPSLRRLAVYAGSLSTAITSSLAQLRRPWNIGMRTVANFRRILGRHGLLIPTGIDAGTAQQQSRVLSGELLLGGPIDTSKQQTQLFTNQYYQSPEANRKEPVDAVLPVEQRPVYDIINAGPRQRFVVAGNEGPVVVHNCIQCLARITVGEQALEIAKRYRVVTLSHDEVVYLAPASKARKALDFGIEALSQSPHWAPDLPLAAEGKTGKVYVKP